MFRRNKEQGEDSGDGLGLEILAPPPNASDRDAIVDIIFVHGLGGKRYHTWTKDGVLWPRDLLAKDFTRARIMTWGYDANIMKFFGPTGQSNIRDHAKALNFDLCQARREDHQIDRPIIFVAHSLGGLVVKKALFISYLEAVKQTAGATDQRLAALYAYTKGILFAGTPHRGSNVAKWVFTATRLAWLVQSDRNAELIRTLRQGSQRLDDIQEDFKQILENFAVYSLLEEMPFPKIGKIVEKDSALIGWHETEVLIHANHRDMVKFASDTDNNYKRVRNIIGDIIGDRIDGAVTERIGTPRITRSRTWCPSGDKRSRDAPPFTERPMERSTTIGAIPQATQTAYTSSPEDEFASALKQGEYYFRQTNKNDPKNLEAAMQNFTRAYDLMKESINPNPGVLVEILLEMVQVRTEMSYQRVLSPKDKMMYVNGAILSGKIARVYALSSSVVGHLALVKLHQAILLGREAEIYDKLGTTAVEVRKKKTKALQEIATSLGALRESGQPDTDRYRKWADDWRIRLTRT